jgi:predicted nuclease of restriction endonuclease-like RecB superfamily
MLTGDLVRPRMRRKANTLSVDFVRVEDRHWQNTAAELIDLFGTQLGQPRAAWEAALERYEGERVDYIVLRGLAKVLEDVATFTPRETTIAPADLRERLFAHGPVFTTRDLFTPQTRKDLLRKSAKSLGIQPDDLEITLFADRPADYLLREIGATWTPELLLNRYNMELARGVLYWASAMQVEIHDHYKDFWRYLKLFKLMFEVVRLPTGGYRVQLDGPISPFVKATTRYGRQFAAFLPALFLGDSWTMQADVQNAPGGDPLTYSLDSNSPLQSHFKASGLFDSGLEADFARQFEEKFGDQRGNWLLHREDEVIVIADHVFIPDFAIEHKQTGQRALVEIVGFWHPDYLRRKLDKVRRAGLHNLILLVYEGVNLTPEKLADVPGQVLYFPNKPVLKDVMAAVESCAITGAP